MAIDTSSYAQAAGVPKTLADYQAENQQVQQNALNLQSGQQKLAAYTTDQNMLNQFRGAFTPGADQTSPAFANSLYAADPQRAAAFMKTQQDQATSRALANKDQGSADESQQKVKDQAFAHFQNSLGTVQSPQEAANFITASYHDPIVGPMLQAHGSLEDGLNLLQQHSATPEGFQQWKALAAVGMQKMAEGTKVNQINTGGTTNTQTYNPYTNTTNTVASVPNTIAPDTAATVAATRRGQDITAATAKAGQNIEAVKADPYGALGLNKNVPVNTAAASGLSGDDYLNSLAPGVAAQVKALADGRLQISPRSAQSGPGAELLRMAMQYEPGTDQTTYASRVATAKDAATGTLAKSNNALNTLAGHLSELSDSAAALNNTSIPLLNGFKNWASDAIGDPQLKTFNTNAHGVIDEFEKVYRSSGGTQAGIDEWKKNLGDANSPEQFRAVMAKGAEMVESKLEANNAQYAQGMSGKVGSYSSITPKAQAAFDKIRGINGTSAAPAATAAAAAPSGFKITHIDGKPQ